MNNSPTLDILIWWLFAIIAGLYVGKKKGYNTGSIFFLLLLTGPLAAIPIFVLPPNQEKLDDDAVNNGNKKYCPYCATAIPVEAIKCPRCTSNLIEETESNNTPSPDLPQPKQPTTGPIEKKIQKEASALRIGLTVLAILGIATLCQITLTLT